MDYKIDYKIDKNIPTPIQRYCKYPFKDMEVGDSFFVDSKSNNMLSVAKYFAKQRKLDWVFTVRKENGGTRIWRIK
jgi:hypothetical protein